MKSVLVLLANGCEEIEAVTIIDVLRRADIQVTTASLDTGTQVHPVTASRKVVLIADTTLDQAMHLKFDMLVLPGGLPGTDYLNEDARVHQLLQQMTAQNNYVAAICAAPKVLAAAGLLKHKQATSYPGVLQSLHLEDSNLLEQNVVIDDKIITSQGPATAMEFALTLVEQLSGSQIRDKVAQGLLFR